MISSKLQWKKAENFKVDEKLDVQIVPGDESARETTLGWEPMKVSAFRHRRRLDMLRGCVKIGEKERSGDERREVEDSHAPSSPSCQSGYNLIQCVERFFKNPQQNYEVPLQLLQEWFSDTALTRRLELAKLFLSLLQDQGLDMDQILNHPDDNCNNKNNEEFVQDTVVERNDYLELDPDSHLVTEDLNGHNVELRNVICGNEEFANQAEWVEEVGVESGNARLTAPAPAVLRQYKRHANGYQHQHSSKIKMARIHKPDSPENNNVEVVGAIEDTALSLENSMESEENTTHVEEYATISIPEDLEEGKHTRSVGTSPYEEHILPRSSSLSNIHEKNCKSPLRKSQSLPTMKLDIAPPTSGVLPPLAPIEAIPKSSEVVKESLKYVEYVQPVNKPTVISRTVSSGSYKARTTFVEMSQADFVRRQTLLNDRVSLRQSFRLGGQILYVPELVSCSTPIVEKAPPLLVHSEGKKTRNPVEIKLAMMGSNQLAENVVVSHNSSSHTIHYTPTHSHVTVAPTQLINDKCSVVYVTESAPHAQPVLVATTPSWQEEARKKPIIAYAKRKPADKLVLADNMKVLISQNGVLNSVDVQPTKVITHCRPESINKPVITRPVDAADSHSDIVFLKKVSEGKTHAVAVAPAESPPPQLPAAQPKPTLPKFNQTFVQNLQVKTARAAEPIADAQPIEYVRKMKKTFSPVGDIGAETTISSEAPDEVVASHTPGVIHALPVPVMATPAPTPVVVERPAAKTTASAPPPQVGLLIYTQGSHEESSQVQTLLLTTLPNGSAYCVRLPANANIHNVSTPVLPPQVDAAPRSVVVQALSHSNCVTVKSVVKKPDTVPATPQPPPAESNKVALLKDLKEFENVFEETKLKFEKEKQLNVGEIGENAVCVPAVGIETAVQTSPLPSQISPPIITIPKFDCEKLVVGVKRKPDDIPIVTRLYTTAKKPLIVVSNYGHATAAQVQARPLVTQMCSTSPPVAAHLKSPKPKTRTGKTYPSPAKSPPAAKPQQKPQEDEKTQQKIFAILEEYAVQKEHSPDTNNRPAPRRRSNPPTGASSKKKRPLLKAKETSGESDEGSFSEM